MKEKRKRIGRTRPIVKGMGMQIRLSIDVIEGEEILINGIKIGYKHGSYLYIINNVSYSKKQLSKQLGQLCSNFKVVIIEKESFFFGVAGLSPRQSIELEEQYLFSKRT